MSDSCWSVLAMAPSADAREIRRAYAKQLKIHRPDRDPQGFQLLRQAFDQAMLLAVDLLTEPATDGIATESAPGGAQPAGESATLAAALLPIEQDLAALEDALAGQDEVEGLSCLDRLLKNPAIKQAERHQRVETQLLDWLSQYAHAVYLWPEAQAFFAWDPASQPFRLCWPQVVKRLADQRLAALAQQLAQDCAQSADNGLNALQAVLSGDGMLGLDERMAFYQFWCLELLNADWLDSVMFDRIGRILEWPADHRCPWGIDTGLWHGVLQQLAQVESEKTWRAMLHTAATDRSRTGAIVRAVLPPYAKRLVLKSLNPGLIEQVSRYLDYLENERPALFARLASDVVVFWRTRAARLHTGKKQWQRAGYWLWLAGCTAAHALFFWRVFGVVMLSVAGLLVLEPMLTHWTINRRRARSVLQWGRWAVFSAMLALPLPLYKLLQPLNLAASPTFLTPLRAGAMVLTGLLLILGLCALGPFRKLGLPARNPLGLAQSILSLSYLPEAYVAIPFASGLVCGLLGGELLSLLYLV